MSRLCGLLLVAVAVGAASHWLYLAIALPEEPPRVSCEFAWLSRELNLTGEQRRKVAALHDKYEPVFEHLSRRLRQRGGESGPAAAGIGSASFALEELGRICESQTASLVCQVGQVLDAEQRASYFALAQRAFALEGDDIAEVYAARQSCRRKAP